MKEKIKRLLAALLAAVLLCGGMPAALAVDGDPPLYEYQGFESPDAFMDYMQEMYIFTDVDYEWVSSHYAANLATCADEAFLREYWLEAYGYRYLESICDVYGVTMEELPMYTAYLMTENDWYGYYSEMEWGEEETGVWVQLNGVDLEFPDAQPELTDNRTMVPLRYVAEQLGATVGWDNRRVTLTRGARTLAFAVGETALQITEDGKTETISMDVAPYVKDDRTYVPVRFFAEAFDLTVLWDENYNTAVLYDRAAMIEDIDSRFTVYNQFLQAQPVIAEGQAMQMAIDLAIDFTMLDSLSGDKSYKMDGTLEVVTQDDNFEMSLQMDLYALIGLLRDQLDDQMGNILWDTEAIDELMQALESLESEMKNATLDIIFNAETGMIYVRCPLLVQAVRLIAPESEAIASGTWLSMEYGTDALDILTTDTGVGAGQTLGETMLSSCETMPPAWMFDQLETNLLMYDAFFSDARFTGSGAVRTAHFDKTIDDVDRYDENIWGQDTLLQWLSMSAFSSVKGDITLNLSSGRINGEIELFQPGTWMLFFETNDQRLRYTFDLTAPQGTITYELHEKNESILTVRADLREQTAAGGSAASPAPTDKVVDWYEWLWGDEMY